MKCNQDDKKIEFCHKDKKSAVQKFPLAFGNTAAGNSENRNISQETKDITDRLLPEKIPPAGISRAASVFER